MDSYYVLTCLYGKLNNIRWLPFWILTPFRRIINEIINGIIVSLTSYPARINVVWNVIKCLKNQSSIPEKIILWLYDAQFTDRSIIPASLMNEVDDLFEIRFVDKNLRSHTKYYYAIKNYPDSTIITCDDDVYYDPNMIKRLIETSKKYPNCIIANHSRRITYENKELLPYLMWDQKESPFDNENRLQLGVGGCLYPPHCLHRLLLNDILFMDICPYADDIWLNSMSRLIGTPVVQVDKNILLLDIYVDSPKLTTINNGEEHLNDEQIKKIREYLHDNYYPDVYSHDYMVKL